MGRPKFVYMTDENHKRLSGEQNASAIVNHLLNEYYKHKSTPEEQELELAKEIEKASEDIKKLQAEYEMTKEKVNNKKEEELLKQQMQKEDYEKDKMRLLKKQELRVKFESLPHDERNKYLDFSEFYERNI